MKSFWTAFLLIFVAELGDKTQFMTLALSSRYKAMTILVGVSLGTMLVSLVSVLLGRLLGNILPQNLMNIAAGIIFIIFGLQSLRHYNHPDENTAKENEKSTHRFAWLTIASTFFLAELADKTMIATIAIAGRDNNYFAVWLGATLGLIVSNCLALVVGRALDKYLTGKTIHLISAGIFIIAGALAIWHGFNK